MSSGSASITYSSRQGCSLSFELHISFAVDTVRCTEKGTLEMWGVFLEGLYLLIIKPGNIRATADTRGLLSTQPRRRKKIKRGKNIRIK